MINNSKTINIFGTTYTIEYVDKIDIEEPNFRFGEESSADHTIKIALKYNEAGDIEKSELDKNLIHEIIHAILDEGQYFQESNNEPLVEWLARCIYNILKQNII